MLFFFHFLCLTRAASIGAPPGRLYCTERSLDIFFTSLIFSPLCMTNRPKENLSSLRPYKKHIFVLCLQPFCRNVKFLSCGSKPTLKLLNFSQPTTCWKADTCNKVTEGKTQTHTHTHRRGKEVLLLWCLPQGYRRVAASELLLHDWGPPERSPSAPPGPVSALLSSALLSPARGSAFTAACRHIIYARSASAVALREMSAAAVSPRAPCKPCSPASA